ncbi:monomethylamine:corrinoid methyltransferase [Candidatus Formimonas warabiya]|uniref:Monomethylamine:corrinoid methyltransferase n=1 Tax=Formimonas warabiya TaxID=1761012 RepID=A0A3G1KQX1_FORW1|nr:monomethylamine:corrinoid methyltransferase [Candidatus Formimonas warabiya]ATW24858.1 hypothetical protein DCMF_08800 [Candidatus Formimonas warabiya]
MSLRREKLLKSLEKAFTGPICSVKEWDTKIIPQTIKEKLKKYGLQNTLDMENPINTDDDLADQFFKAGHELALELGMLNVETERIIKITEEELKHTLMHKPKELTLGSGPDTVLLKVRKPEDPTPPLLCASLGIVVSEDLYVPIVEGLVKYRKLVDVLHGPSLATIYGQKVRSGTPYETLMGRYEVELRRHALWRAGRPGMANTGVAGAVTEFGHLGGAAAMGGPGNVTMALCPVEMKTNFSVFHRIMMAINYDMRIRAGGFSYIGGYAGPAEGAALANVATDLLIGTVLDSDYTSSYVYDIQLFGNCGRKALWANSVSIQAVSRNTNLIRNKIVNETGGPCTDMFMYEAAVGLMNHCVSGASKTTQPRSAGGKFTDHLTPMEAWWCGEVFKSCAGMTRKDANEVAKKVLPKYEERLTNPPKGKSVLDCFDLKEMRPLPEYERLYLDIRKELIDLGMPLDKVYNEM